MEQLLLPACRMPTITLTLQPAKTAGLRLGMVQVRTLREGRSTEHMPCRVPRRWVCQRVCVRVRVWREREP